MSQKLLDNFASGRMRPGVVIKRYGGIELLIGAHFTEAPLSYATYRFIPNKKICYHFLSRGKITSEVVFDNDSYWIYK